MELGSARNARSPGQIVKDLDYLVDNLFDLMLSTVKAMGQEESGKVAVWFQIGNIAPTLSAKNAEKGGAFVVYLSFRGAFGMGGATHVRTGNTWRHP